MTDVNAGGSVTKIEFDPQNPSNPNYWTNRRRMAWVSMICLVLMGFIGLLGGIFIPGAAIAIDSMSFFLSTILMCFSGVVFAYIGATSYVDVRAYLKK